MTLREEREENESVRRTIEGLRSIIGQLERELASKHRSARETTVINNSDTETMKSCVAESQDDMVSVWSAWLESGQNK